MAARRPFWKWHRWKSIGFCLWPPSTCIWNLKLKFQSKLDLCSGNHAVYRQTDGQTDRRTRWIQYTPPSNFVGRGYKYSCWHYDMKTISIALLWDYLVLLIWTSCCTKQLSCLLLMLMLGHCNVDISNISRVGQMFQVLVKIPKTFQMIFFNTFHESKVLNLDSNFTEVCEKQS